ncbi:MAG: PP2C family protein-serine/threonine phosphatase [bacterium]|nr:PP2C family protein-serine/threonine phosphatase [bacterium]
MIRCLKYQQFLNKGLVMQLTHASEQGMRPYQEDRLFIKRLRLANDLGVFLAVMDGHSGERVAQFCRDSLASVIVKVIESKKKVSLAEIQAIFRLLNEQTSEMESGSTLSLVFISYQHEIVHVGILGDSPVVVKGSDGQVFISPEHNARTNLKEREAAIQRGACYSGGYICEHPSRNGLQMTRSLGDNEFRNFLDRSPEVYSMKIDSESFVALLSDGIADPGHESSNSLKPIISIIENGASASDLVKNALERKTRDNVTAIVWRR